MVRRVSSLRCCKVRLRPPFRTRPYVRESIRSTLHRRLWNSAKSNIVTSEVSVSGCADIYVRIKVAAVGTVHLMSQSVFIAFKVQWGVVKVEKTRKAGLKAAPISWRYLSTFTWYFQGSVLKSKKNNEEQIWRKANTGKFHLCVTIFQPVPKAALNVADDQSVRAKWRVRLSWTKLLELPGYIVDCAWDRIKKADDSLRSRNPG